MKITTTLFAVALALLPNLAHAAVACVSPTTGDTLTIDDSQSASAGIVLAHGSKVVEKVAPKEITSYTNDASGIGFSANDTSGAKLMSLSAAPNEKGVIIGVLTYAHTRIVFHCTK